jgi:hypothetical protein
MSAMYAVAVVKLAPEMPAIILPTNNHPMVYFLQVFKVMGCLIVLFWEGN